MGGCLLQIQESGSGTRLPNQRVPHSRPQLKINETNLGVCPQIPNPGPDPDPDSVPDSVPDRE
jgi:hypothetical protein